MRKFLLTLALLGAAFSTAASAAHSPDGLWQDSPYPTAARGASSAPLPSEYRLLRLDAAGLEQRLRLRARAPEEGATTLDIPLPDGRFETFRLRPVELMAPELAARYPEIRTFEGESLEDPARWGRFDWTPLGFHGYLRYGTQTLLVNPRTEGEREIYLSFYREHLPLDLDPAAFANDLRIPADRPQGEGRPLASRGERGFGSQFRTLRLAVAATGEYTLYHGGTVATGLAAVVTAINRVAGIYQQDLAVKLQLVANNDRIIYTDPASDPYTNSVPDLLADQNRTNLDQVIGNANYDIGHVFATSIGGLSYLGVVCNDLFKGGGATGKAAPTGDAFWVDYVAHELGHQFGADHSYNGTQEACGWEREAATAYEPGSGSTIMGYAGICGSDDLQGHSDAYFHTASIQQIQDYLAGSGDCAALSASGNTPPVGNPGVGGYYLPVSTPFYLTGSASDADGDGLTYAWEEYDLGPAGSPNFPSGNAPILRSWSPSANPTRYFPRLDDLFNGTSSYGELLPSYGRSLDFMLTVRDGKGGVDSRRLGTPLSVTASAGPFTVSQPASSTTYIGGAGLDVAWNVANTQLSPVSCAQVNISLWTSGGGYALATGTSNDGAARVALPNEEISGARVLVGCANNLFFNVAPAILAVKKITTPPTNLILSAQIFATGSNTSYSATDSITTEGTLIVQAGAQLTLQAPVIRLTPGFHAQAGSTVSIGQ
jgi:hypothetical protein